MPESYFTAISVCVGNCQMFLGGVFVFCACENLTEYEGLRSDYAR
jgi:hypothetical protein